MITKYHRLSGLIFWLRNTFIFSWFWRLEIHDQGASKCISSEGSLPCLQMAAPYYDFTWPFFGTWVQGGRQGEMEREGGRCGVHALCFFTAICKASPVSHFAFLHFFSMGMVLIPVSCTMSQTFIHSSSGTLSDLVP